MTSSKPPRANRCSADPLYHLGRWAASHRWLVIGLWCLILALALPFAPRASQVLSPGGFSTARLEAAQASSQIQQALGENPAAILVIFHHPTLKNTQPAYYDAVDRASSNLRTLDIVARVTTHRDNPTQAAPDEHTAYATVALRTLPEQFRGVIPRIQGAIQPTELQTTLTGAPIFFSDIQEVTETDLRRAEMISFPFAGLALLLVFGSVVAAVVPALAGGSGRAGDARDARAGRAGDRDVDLRAEPGHHARPGPRHRLLAVHRQPFPR